MLLMRCDHTPVIPCRTGGTCPSLFGVSLLIKKKCFHQGANPKQHAVSLICGAFDKHLPDAMCVHPCMHAMLCSYKCGVSIGVGITYGLSSVVMCMAHGLSSVVMCMTHGLSSVVMCMAHGLSSVVMCMAHGFV